MHSKQRQDGKETLRQKILRTRGPFFEPDLHDQARFLKAVATLIGPLIVAGDILVHLTIRRAYRYHWLDVKLAFVVVVLVAVPYLLKHASYRVVARLFVVNLLVVVSIIGVASYNLGISAKPVADADFFVYLLLPLLLSSALLPFRDTAVLALGTVAFEIVLPFLLPGLTLRDMTQSLLFMFFGIPILVFITKYRESLERHRTNALKESEERYRNLAELLPLSVFETDTAGRFTFVNQAALECFGYSLEDMKTGVTVMQVLSPEDHPRLADSVPHILQGEARPGTEYSGRRKDGTLFPIISYTGRVVKDGQPIGMRGAVIDLTERKETEQKLADLVSALTRSNKDLEQFAYIASHDLQEPLRMVSSYLQLLGKRHAASLQGEAREFMDYAVDGAARMQGMIQDLLTYSRVNTEAQPLRPISMQKVYDVALLNLQQAIADTGAVVDSDPLPSVLGQESQLVQLLQNLLANAMKFRSVANPVVHVGVRESGRFWEFSVQDNGIGIDPQYSDRIFLIFQRLHRRDQYPGSGIGLAVCKRIVERHGGSIRVESQKGKGAKFIFTLPKGE